jgi:predicted nucleotidyltransferase
MALLQPKVPVDALTIAATRRLNDACDALGLQCLMVGATARVIVLEHVLGLRPGRATRDVDFAVAVDSWDAFDALKQRLVSTGYFVASAQQKQRLYFHVAGAMGLAPGQLNKPLTGMPVDIVPFGGVELPDRIVAWPPDLAQQLNVMGYADVLAGALEVAIAHDLVVRIASLPGQALLKIGAWADRGVETEGKDGRDLAILLGEYERAGEPSHIYDQDPSVCESLDWQPALMGAHLLGTHACNLASEQTRMGILRVLEDERLRHRLETDMARQFAYRDDALDHAAKMLTAFTRGFAT